MSESESIRVDGQKGLVTLKKEILLFGSKISGLQGKLVNFYPPSTDDLEQLKLEKTNCVELLQERTELHVRALDDPSFTNFLEVKLEQFEEKIERVLNSYTELISRCTLGHDRDAGSPSRNKGEAVVNRDNDTTSSSHQSHGGKDELFVNDGQPTIGTVPAKYHALKLKQVGQFKDNTVGQSVNLNSKPQKRSMENVREQPGFSCSLLRPHANPFQPPHLSSTSRAFQYVPHQAGSLFGRDVPAIPHISLEPFDGNILKYINFKRQFTRYVENVYLSAEDRMTFLESLCVGQAQDVIAGLSCLEDRAEAYALSWDRLEKRFGNPRRLVAEAKRDLLDGPPVKDWDAKGLRTLCDKMYRCEASFRGWGKEALLNNDELLQRLFCQIPYKLRTQFVALSHKDPDSGTFSDLRELVEIAASEADSEFGQLHNAKDDRKLQHIARGNNQKSVNKPFKLCNAAQHSLTQNNSNVENAKLCPCCSKMHRLWKCSIFKEKSVKQRKEFLKQERLCFNCLNPGHRVAHCSSKISCLKCNKRHNTLLHDDPLMEPTDGLPDSGEQVSMSEDQGLVSTAHDSSQAMQQTIFKVVPVKVWVDSTTKAVQTYAFIDEGSSINICSKGLVTKLGLPIRNGKMALVTANAVTIHTEKVDNLTIQGLFEASAFQLQETLVMDEVVDVSASIPTNDLAKSYQHLQNLSFPELKEKKVELLLGSDLHQAYLLKDTRIGKPGQPTGMHAALGWTIYGKDHGNQEVHDIPRVVVNFLHEATSVKESCEEVLNVMAQDFSDLHLPQVSCMSVEDKRALNIMKQTVKKVGNHFSIGLPWKSDNPQLLNNRCMAIRRLQGLKKRFLVDPDLHKRCSEKMQEYIDNGYAIVVSQDVSSPPGSVHYIPHHCTSLNTKFRVVFDCSAKFQGLSLNDHLLQGPDLTNSLIGVLLRFRQRPIALIGDIKAMFSQVLVDERDRNVYRFVWFPSGDVNKPPIDYCMQTHVFGTKCSPSCAAFALQKTAEENVTAASQHTVEVVRKNFYVDDLCTSCDNVQEAVQLKSQLCKLLESGGFHLTKFLSNSKEVLARMSAEDMAPDFKFADTQLPNHKTLGVVWDATSDKLRVKVSVKNQRCTRRGVLSVIGQTYDPFGLLQPFLLPARQLLQEACRKELDWDKELSSRPGLSAEWDRWLGVLSLLEDVSVDRSFMMAGKKATRFELHTFCDASTYGYGTCYYLRVLYDDDEVQCCFVMGKSRVAPLKFVSVPRLELVAAVLAAKLSAVIVRELQFELSSVRLGLMLS